MAPIAFSSARFAIGGLAMLSILYWQTWRDAKRLGARFRFFPAMEKQDRKRLMVVAVIGATLAPWMGIEGLSLTHGARAALWLALGPAISSVCGRLMSTETMGRYGYTGVLLTVFGTLTLALDGLRPGQGYWAGDLLLFLALTLTVVELHLIKPLARKYGSISMVALRTLIGGMLYLLIASPALAEANWMGFGFWTWFAILAGGAVGVGIGQWVKVRALRILGPTRVVIYGNLVPVAALFIAWLSIGTDPSLFELTAAILIISGAMLIQVVDVTRQQVTSTPEEDELSVVSSGKQD